MFKDEPALRALILYPMNALVNDQLGRLRALFGDPRIVELFMKWAGRPLASRATQAAPRMPGVRTSESDQRKLQPFEKYYVDTERLAKGEPSEQQEDALRLLRQLKARGKWPSKPDLAAWFGDKARQMARRQWRAQTSSHVTPRCGTRDAPGSSSRSAGSDGYQLLDA